MTTEKSAILQRIKNNKNRPAPGTSALEILTNPAYSFEAISNFSPEGKPEEESTPTPPPTPAITLGPNQFLFSSVTGGRLGKSNKDWVMWQYEDNHWSEEHKVNIPAIDPFYRWDPEVLEALWLAVITQERALLVGPPGTGKTTAAQQLAAWMRQPFARFNGKDGIEPAAFLGYAWATKEGMEWKDGLMPQAVQNGYFVVVDEIFKLPPGVQMSMQSLYETGGFLMLDEKPGTIKDKHVYPAPSFFLCATDNTKGTGDGLESYAAGQMQDISSLDRFGVTQEVKYLKKSDEISMLQSRYPAVDPKDITKAVAFANLVRTAFIQNHDLALTLSPRGLCVTCKLMEQGVQLADALQLAYVNKLGDDQELQTASRFITDVI
jgi:cobaltochelatase CobS